MGFSLHFIIATCIVTVSSIVLEVPGYAKIKGVQSISSYNHRRYFSFHNLPYAKQPTNLTRFLVTQDTDNTSTELTNSFVSFSSLLFLWNRFQLVKLSMVSHSVSDVRKTASRLL